MANISNLHVAVLCWIAICIVGLAGTCTTVEAQTFSVLYNFGAHSGDPTNPTNSGIIAQGRDGNLYTTVDQAGPPGSSGAAVRITPTGTLTLIHGFSGADGIFPAGGLSLGTDGNFYGTTSGGGFAPGTIFKMTAGGTLSTLYNFTNGTDGQSPTAPPIQGLDGNFYGTASNGNQGNGNYGTVYKFTPSGTFTTLHIFDFTTGAGPFAPLMQGTDGNFYGTTETGNPSNEGNVFRISSSGKFKALFNFDATHGANPFAPLIQGKDGNFYGTAKTGAAHSLGAVFKITRSGKITVLYSFAGTGDGAEPVGGLVQATDGNFYGTTQQDTANSGCGTIFRISPTGTFTTLFTFPNDGSMGCNPQVTLAQHTSGVVYGDTVGGGTGNNNHGVFYSLNAGLQPFVSFLPASGKVGDTIEFLGQGFTGTTAVSFSGAAATFQVVSDTYLTATVPSGAKTGTVSVTTPGGKLTSKAKFLVTPQITSFAPTSGPVGTVVTISGMSLIQTTKVTFGGVKATSFMSNSDIQVTATVPTGAKTGKIGITTPGGIATSAATFTVTP